ncbi:MAG: Zn-ribbon domain-containing OB-fold protein [Halosimplex sp.]
MSDNARDGAYDDLLDAIEAGEGYYLECENGHGWLPPRRVCPECRSRDLTETPLPDSGEVATFTTVAVATPQFSADTPYVTAIVDYGPVRVTGLLRDVDPEDVAVGMPVGIGIGERETTGDRAIVFRPR